MNKRKISSVTIAVLAILAIIPVIPIRANAAANASLSVTQSAIAGSPGDTLIVSVDANLVGGLVAYDVQLSYSGLALHATGVDFSGPFAGSSCRLLPVVESFSDATGTVRAAITTFNGCTVDVASATPVFTVTFQVISRENSPLHIATDSECACSSLASLVSGNVVTVSHSTSDGTFFAEPNVLFAASYFATVSFDCQNCAGTNQVVLISPVFVPNTETLPGFAYVVFDVRAPNGHSLPVTSQIVFLQPGKSFTLTSTSVDLAQSGTYNLYVTLYRGSTPGTIVPFQTAKGLSFRIS